MKNLVYKKIQTSDRLPKDYGYYNTERGQLSFSPLLGRFLKRTGLRGETGTILKVKWWLEEISNREEELADLLQDAINYLDDTKWEDHQFETLGNLTMNAQNLIWEIKNNAPKLLDDE